VSKALVIAHRGASARELENSLAAFRAAGPLGADAIELDVHATADGALVVHHDETLDARHHIPSLTASRVRELRLSNGEPIPTLAEALEAAGPKLQVFVEVKSLAPVFDERLFDTLSHGPNPSGYAVHSFDHRVVRRLGLECPALRRGVLSSSYAVKPLAVLEDAGATILWQERAMVDEVLVETLHRRGMTIVVWTVDDPAEMRRLVEYGADGICTNVPDRARGVVDAPRAA
jgi:glycerophosphoryl diester phosphodiesterase